MTDIEIVERPPAVVIGLPVLAPFRDLGTLVPAEWQALAGHLGDDQQSAPLAELSVDLGDGRYHETVGLLVDLEDGPPAGLPGAVRSLVPGGRWVQAHHDGPAGTIAETFGRLLAWATAHGERAGAHKLDVGYRLDGTAEHHVLAVELGTAASP